MDYRLSILIPARNEEFIAATVSNILKQKRGKTEVIVGLDGAWADPGIEDHEDVRVVYFPKSIGQRAMTNRLARLSSAKYLAKTDAHVAFDEGFDVKLMEHMQDDWTIVPLMKNLHAFDWKCQDCGYGIYQGPKPQKCIQCLSEDFQKEIVFAPREKTPNSTSYRFNTDLQFKYFGKGKRNQNGDLVETLSLQGSFFMMTREKYWELDICDENWGSWGQQGTEVALKTWLSGGTVICDKSTWYAHLFRTQTGFSFPYPMNGKDQQRARQISQDVFLNNKWPLQTRSLKWLLQRFWDDLSQEDDGDGKNWTQAKLDTLPDLPGIPAKGIIYYTDNQLNLKIAKRVQKQLLRMGLPIVSSSLKPMGFGLNVPLALERGSLTMFKQQLAALEASTADIVYFCEADVLYHPSHFDFTPPLKDKFYYNQNWVKVWPDEFAAHWDANQVSGLCCYREHALEFYRNRVKEIEENGFDRSYEPGGRDPSKYEVWNSEYPNIDIRHDNNLTKSHRSVDEFRDKSTAKGWKEYQIDQIPGWPSVII